MRERSLVAFTLLVQTAVGLFWALSLVWWSTADQSAIAVRTPLLVTGLLIAAAVLASAFHLGTPRNAWRALSNLGRSWLSREILFLALFGAGWAIVAAMAWLGAGQHGVPMTLVGLVVALVAGAGGGLVYSMARVYRLRTVPAWDTALTTATFFLTALSLGPLAAVVIMATAGAGPAVIVASRMLVVLAGLALAVELWLEAAWHAHLRAAAIGVDAGLNPPAGAAAGRDMGRQTLLVVALALIVMATLVADLVTGGPPHELLVALALAAALGAAAIGRAGFYGSYARRGV